MIEHNIALIVEKELDISALRIWYNSVTTVVPSVVTTVSVDGEPVQIVKRKDADIRYFVPLLRDLTDDEANKIIAEFSHGVAFDFSVAVSTSPLDIAVKPDIEIDHGPLIALCTKWAKKKHDDWLSEKNNDGWRYGPTVNPREKTHPLIRPWHELPAKHREVDHTPAQELLDLLREAGYLVIHSDDLDNLLGGR